MTLGWLRSLFYTPVIRITRFKKIYDDTMEEFSHQTNTSLCNSHKWTECLMDTWNEMFLPDEEGNSANYVLIVKRLQNDLVFSALFLLLETAVWICGIKLVLTFLRILLKTTNSKVRWLLKCLRPPQRVLPGIGRKPGKSRILAPRAGSKPANASSGKKTSKRVKVVAGNSSIVAQTPKKKTHFKVPNKKVKNPLPPPNRVVKANTKQHSHSGKQLCTATSRGESKTRMSSRRQQAKNYQLFLALCTQFHLPKRRETFGQSSRPACSEVYLPQKSRTVNKRQLRCINWLVQNPEIGAPSQEGLFIRYESSTINKHRKRRHRKSLISNSQYRSGKMTPLSKSNVIATSYPEIATYGLDEEHKSRFSTIKQKYKNFVKKSNRKHKNTSVNNCLTEKQ